MVQPDVKKLVAYSSVSHLGFVMLGIWAASVQSVQGAILIMINHGLSTGALFFLIGMIYERRHTREISALRRDRARRAGLRLIFTVVALSSIGLPGLNGFIGEFLVLLGSFGRFPWATGIATTGVIFAAAYLLWALQRIIFNKLDNPENEKLTDLTPRELAVLGPLLLGIVWLGLYPAPDPAAHRARHPGIRRVCAAGHPGRHAGAGARRGPHDGGAPVNPIDTSTPIGVTLALLPEIVLSLAAMGVLLVTAWRHETPEDSRRAGLAQPRRHRRGARRAALALDPDRR